MKAKALLSFLTCCSFRPKITVLVSLCLFLPAGGVLGPFQAEGGNRGRGGIAKVFQSQLVMPGAFHGDLRDLPKAKGWQPGALIREVPRIVPQPPRESAPPQRAVQSQPPQVDPLLQLQQAVATRTFAPPDLNFDGIPFTGARPPDTVGEVGPNHYIQMVNDGAGGSAVSIYDKTGTLIAGPVSLQTLSPPGLPCSMGSGDPIVLYDRLADRWLMSEFADIGNHLCLYVSQTGDPVSGGWFLYDLPTPNFPDYPKWAVWPDAYYISTNEPGGSPVYALDRSQVLLGNTTTFLRTGAPDMPGFGFQALIPSDLDGPTPPPAGSPNFFMRHRDDEVHNAGSNNPTLDFLEIWEFSVDFVTPANSTFTQVANIPVAEFDSDLCGLTSFECFPQPGTTTGLDPLREVIMWRLQYRNFGTYETLVGNFVTDVDGTDHGGIRWFELRKTGSGAWSLFQEGTHAPDSDHRWMGSIAMDGAGNIALGYSVSSDTTFPSIRYSGRRATDPSGTLPLGEVTLVAGGGSQTGSPQTAPNRWGDYSSMNVDPADDRTFWYTNEYIPDGTGFWQTRIGVFNIPPPDPFVSRIVLGLAGPEGQGWMEVVDKDPPHSNITWLQVPWPAYNAAVGGTHPALCNLDNDPEDELVVGLDAYPADGGWIEIKDDRNTNYAHLAWIQVPWADYNAANGATFPACGDFDGDGRDEIAVGLGTDGGGWIEIKDDGVANYAHLDWIQVPWADYNAANGGTYPAAGDFDGDGRDEIAVGLGTDGSGWMEIKDDGIANYAHLDWTQVPWADYNAANGATYPAAGDFDADGRDEIAVGLGTYPDAGGWFEVKDDLDAGFGHLSWGRLHWTDYNSTNGETRPGLER